MKKLAPHLEVDVPTGSVDLVDTALEVDIVNGGGGLYEIPCPFVLLDDDAIRIVALVIAMIRPVS